MPKKKKKSILDFIPDEAAVFEPRSDYDQAIIGISKCGRVIYCEEEIIEILMRNDETIDRESAMDFISYNMESGASSSDFPPIIQQSFFRDNEYI